MKLKRISIITGIIIFALLFSVVAALSCFYLFIPDYIESHVIPDLKRKNNLNILSMQVRNIGAEGIELSDVIMGMKGDGELRIDSIRLDYSLTGLLNRRIDKITVSGVTAIVQYKNNELSIKGLEGIFNNKDEHSNNGANNVLPVSIDSFLITYSEVVFQLDNQSIHIPFDFNADLRDKNIIPVQSKLNIYPLGHKFTINSSALSHDKSVRISFDTLDFPLTRVEDIVNDIASGCLKGKADMKISGVIILNPIAIKNVSAKISLKDAALINGQVIIENPRDKNDRAFSIDINVESKDGNLWQYDISPLYARLPYLPIKLKGSGSVTIFENGLEATSKITTWIDDSGEESPLEWDLFAGKNNEDSHLIIHLKGKDILDDDGKSFQLSYNNLLLDFGKPEIEIKIDYHEGGLESDYAVDIKNVKIIDNEIKVTSSSLSLSGKAFFDSVKKGIFKTSFLVEDRGLRINGIDIIGKLPVVDVKGTMKYEETKGSAINATVFLEGGDVLYSNGLIKIKGFNGHIPLIWPVGNKGRRGEITVASLEYEDMVLGKIDSIVQQKTDELSFSGRLICSLLKGLDINYSGSISLNPYFREGKISINVLSFEPETDIELGRYSPDLTGIFMNGEFNLSGNLSYTGADVESTISIGLNKGRLVSDDQDWEMKGISSTVIIEDVFYFRSSPSQRLTIDQIIYGDMYADDLFIDFRIDPGPYIFIEQGGFKWCDGKVNIQSFKIIPGKEEYDIILFCDRLKLADILDQFGVATAMGDGTVNGKIPIKILEGKISFQDGFLYSTPGAGGKINITETDLLTAGLPPDSPEYTQMDIAREALKAFEYTWVKMSLESEKDELLLKLQFDGKPENKLPFRYNQDIGRFIRVETAAQGSDFQGIRLDVNFKIPLDEILKYKDVLDMID